MPPRTSAAHCARTLLPKCSECCTELSTLQIKLRVRFVSIMKRLATVAEDKYCALHKSNLQAYSPESAPNCSGMGSCVQQ